MAGELTLTVELNDEYVAGFPVHAALTVMYRVEGVGRPGVSYAASLTEAPELDPFGEPAVVGLEIAEAGTGRVVLRVAPMDPPIEASEVASVQLQPNVPRRVLVDLSPDLERVPPGAYRVRITYAAEWNTVTSEPLPFILREPTREELALPRPRDGETWLEWTLFGGGKTGTPRRDDPARFNRVVRILLRGDAGNPELLELLDGLYAPEASVMMLELLALNEIDITRAAGAVRQRHPALAWWIDAIPAGNGRIAALRRILK